MNKFMTILACALLAFTNTWAAESIRHEQIELTQGSKPQKLSGRIKGYETVEYRLVAPADSVFSLKLKSANGSANFNVSVEGADEALFIGSRDGNHFKGTALTSKSYQVRVYLMRNAARRNESASYVLEAIVNTPSVVR